MTNYETSGANQHRVEPGAGREGGQAWKEQVQAGPAPAEPGVSTPHHILLPLFCRSSLSDAQEVSWWAGEPLPYPYATNGEQWLVCIPTGPFGSQLEL